MTILVTTHYLDEAEQLCDRVAIVTAAASSPSTPRPACWPGSAEIVELRVDGDVERR
jgi:hypothetical protein